MASGIDKASFGGVAGTLGAVLLQFPLSMVMAAFASLVAVFFEHGQNSTQVVQEMVGYPQKARKDGIVSLDSGLDAIADPFLRKSLMLAVDGTEPDELRKIMQLEMENRAER